MLITIVLTVISIAYLYWIMLLCYNVAIKWNILESIALSIVCAILWTGWVISIVLFYSCIFENEEI